MILLVNGPNLNLLGEREPEVYGSTTLADIERLVTETCAQYGIEVLAFQSNTEGALIDFIHEHRHQARGIIMNPGAFTHTSYALHDCLKGVRAPTIEVHISNVHAREEWRRRSVISPATHGQIVGLGPAGYWLAAVHLCNELTHGSQAQAPQPSPAAGAAAGVRRGLEPDQGGEHTIRPPRRRGSPRRARSPRGRRGSGRRSPRRRR
ncbi:MAG TPA: type II 3-dehydroquinate dehydratase, partial [Anaeromyxobacteraceae bacterium]|nr:type II 3-dehydroquinate dehydratase [Anaeromyxobacteraceae bacterium]